MPGPGDQVLGVIVLPGQLVADQVAAVIEPAAGDLLVVPGGWVPVKALKGVQKKGSTKYTYGSVVIFQGKKFYAVASGKYIKSANF